MTKMLIDRSTVEQALEALRCVDLQSLAPDYGSGHYSVARSDGPQVKSAITAMEAALAEPVQEPDCWCQKCNEDRTVKVGGIDVPVAATRMILCPTCGNKRCPHASDHRLACTGSNDPGQPGSVYGSPQRPAGEQK